MKGVMMTEHVDTNRINRDLRYRFEYVSKFLNFTSDDIAMLNTFAPIVFPLLPVISDTVYRKLFSFDITRQYFIIQCDDSGTDLPKTTRADGSESIRYELRKDMLSMYLRRLLSQCEWNDTFLQYLSHIGKIHSTSFDSGAMSVDYVHVNGLLGHLENQLIDVLYKADTIDEQTKCGILIALNKVFWILNDFFTMYDCMPHTDNTPLERKKPTGCCWT